MTTPIPQRNPPLALPLGHQYEEHLVIEIVLGDLFLAYNGEPFVATRSEKADKVLMELTLELIEKRAIL